MHSVSDGSRLETFFQRQTKEFVMVAKVIDPSASYSCATYFLSDEENRTLFDGECDTEDFLQDLARFMTYTQGVGYLDSNEVDVVTDDSGLVLAIGVKYRGNDKDTVLENIKNSIMSTIRTLRLFSPVLGGYR